MAGGISEAVSVLFNILAKSMQLCLHTSTLVSVWYADLKWHCNMAGNWQIYMTFMDIKVVIFKISILADLGILMVTVATVSAV